LFKKNFHALTVKSLAIVQHIRASLLWKSLQKTSITIICYTSQCMYYVSLAFR